MKISVIYQVISKATGKIYVGSAVNYYSRRHYHLSKLNSKNHDNGKLQNHVNKYGLDDLEFSILEEVPVKENLITREQLYLDTMAPEFNICMIAGSPLGTKRTMESRERMRIAQLGKTQSKETRDKRSRSSLGMKKKKWSEHGRMTLSNAMTGIKRGKYKK